jgi:hypothetical protein
MRRWLLVWLVAGLVGSSSGLLSLVANETCACVRAACCPSANAPRGSSGHAGCHGAPRMAQQTMARCGHSMHLRVPPKAGAMPPAVALWPSECARCAAEPIPHSVRDGFTRIESPPPRGPGFLS